MFTKSRFITIGMVLVALMAVKKFAPLSIRKHF